MMIAQVTDYRGGRLCVKVGPGDIQSVIGFIQDQWNTYTEGSPFQYNLLDADFNTLYTADMKTGQLVLFFAGMAIVIACLGIFGLAASTAESRTREVGIRKVAGASMGQITALLSVDFVRCITTAFIIACPMAYFIMQRWLQNFAYRTGIQLWIFAVAGLGTILIALITASWQTVRAARANPVETLKYE